MSTFDHVYPGQYGDFEILSKTPIHHSRETFRMIYEYNVSYLGSEFSFRENEEFSFLVTEKENNVEEYLVFKYLENWFPAKSGCFYFEMSVGHDHHADEIPDINMKLHRDYDDDMYSLHS